MHHVRAPFVSSVPTVLHTSVIPVGNRITKGITSYRALTRNFDLHRVALFHLECPLIDSIDLGASFWLLLLYT